MIMIERETETKRGKIKREGKRERERRILCS
jgi:hypothetical protein